MGFVKIVKKNCRCKMPPVNSGDYDLGTVWQCGACQTRYVLECDREGNYWAKQS
jgi:hypothetical protein